MPDYAYAFFFAAVLIGAAAMLYRSFLAARDVIAAVIEGRLVEPAAIPDRHRDVCVRARFAPLLPLVRISICRL